MSTADRFAILRYTLLAGVVWTLLVGGSLSWNHIRDREGTLELARNEAVANINKDHSFRRWATSHGGVYVAPTAETPPNPYLDVPRRDVVTTDGQKLTLMNPAYMVREMQQRFRGDFGVKGHITSLVLTNPNNAPDAWEAEALRRFERGEAEEVAAVSDMDGKPHMRVIRAMRMEAGCVKCHGHLGYKVGDVRGGISASVDLTPYLARERDDTIALSVSHGAIWGVGLLAIALFNRRAHWRLDEREQAEQEIRSINATLDQHVRERTAALEAANQELESFSYSVSHDLRAPLRAINGYARIIRDEEISRLSPEGQQMLERIWVNAEKMGALIDDILQFSRVGRIELKRDPVDMAGLARAVGAELVGDYPAARLSVAELPPGVGDESALRQVWVNLIGNAFKFSSKREQPEIEIGSRVEEGETVFFVRDNGAGFDLAAASHLFGVFQRMHREQDFPGTGAGLAIVKRIIERHGGRVWAEAAVDRGATFYFTLGGGPAAEKKKPAQGRA
jgi:signal transduction histidine kinase